MKDLKILLFGGFLVILLVSVRIKEGFQSSPDDIMKNPKKVFVLFHANWCGHCKTLKPIWDKVEAKHGDKMTSIEVGDENDPKTAAVKKHFNVHIEGYPSMLVVENGKVMDTYNGGRTEEEITNYVKNNL
jgi:thiol-disulfide isomerase/thioredoxin